MKNRQKWLTLKCFTCHEHESSKTCSGSQIVGNQILKAHIYYDYKQCFIFQQLLSPFQQKNLRIRKKCGNSSINLANFSIFQMHLLLNLHNMETCNVNMIISAATKFPLSHPHAKGAILIHTVKFMLGFLYMTQVLQ